MQQNQGGFDAAILNAIRIHPAPVVWHPSCFFPKRLGFRLGWIDLLDSSLG
jgi:hypothetical protein